MSGGIDIIEKPEWISWDEIHDVLIRAHKPNRDRGIVMRKPTLLGDEIAKEIENGKGTMLVAMDGTSVIGTAAILIRNSSTWYNKGEYGYLCFASVLPEYAGKGVYRELCKEREKIAKGKGLKGLLFDTHHKNKHVIRINERNGYKRVGAKLFTDHWNVVLFKWTEGCPFSDLTCSIRFFCGVLRMFLFKVKKRFSVD